MSIQGNSVGGLLPTAEQVGAATPADVQKAAPVNLLDNSDFRNPVNQRGKTVYGIAGYSIDRWRIAHSNVANTVTVNSGYITLSTSTTATGWIYQLFEANTLTVGKTYTVAVWLLDGSVLVGHATIPAVGDVAVFGIHKTLSGRLSHDMLGLVVGENGDYIISYDIKYVALYEGEYTVETLPEYHPKGYAHELLECQRYYQQDLSTTYTVAGMFDGAGCLDVVIPLKTTMRTIPTVNCIAYAIGVAQGDNTIRLTVENTDTQTVSCSYQWKSTNFICPRYINGSYAWKKAIVTFRYTASADL